MGVIVRDSSGQLWSLDVMPDGNLQTQQITEGTPTSDDSPYCSISLQEVVNWARTHTKLIPIVGVGGFSNEPALTICNNVIQEMLQGGIGPDGRPTGPFPWKWNRTEAAPFDTVDGNQDYEINTITDFGWMESCDVEEKNSTATPKPRYQIEVVRDLHLIDGIGNPQKICWLPGFQGAIKFRISPVPGSTIWTVYPVYQRKPPLKTALTDFWNPIPDELAYVYRQGFLALAKKHAHDPEWKAEYQIFQSLIQKALGLADVEQQNEGFYPFRPIMLG